MIKSLSLSDHAIRWLAASLGLSLFAYEVYVVRVDYSSYLLYLLDFESPAFIAITLVCLALTFFLFVRFVIAAISSAWTVRALCFSIFTLSLLIEYGYQKALGRFTDKADVATAMAATPEQQTASVMMYLSYAVIAPCVVMLAAQLTVDPPKLKKPLAAVFTIVSFLAAFAIFPLVIDQRFPTFATGAFLRTVSDLAISGPIVDGQMAIGPGAAKLPRRSVPPPPTAQPPKRNIVVVVDESTMGSHFSLNGYGRSTTPFLEKLSSDGVLHNWGIAAAASTGSRFTYNAMITGLSPDEFPDRTDVKVSTFPTIFQYAKAMGYRTYFLDAQMNAYWGANQDDRSYIDSWQGILDITGGMAFNTWEVDQILARRARGIISSSTGNLIFIFKYGSHIPYHINYPPDRAVFTPAYQSAGKFDIPPPEQFEAVRNAYDNSIKYNVNSFFENLIEDYSAIPNSTVVIYTGDHGQTLFANGRSSHGGNTKAEAMVPLFLIGKLDAKVDSAYRASHGNIFPTILDLLEYPKELREVTRSPSLLTATKADSRQRFFNPDLGTKVPFD